MYPIRMRPYRRVSLSWSIDRMRCWAMSEMGVRRGKAALSSGCKAHPATAPAGSNRSSHGGNEVPEAFGYRSARAADATMSAVYDRWFAEPLVQVQGAPAAKSAVMFTRIAIMFEVVADRRGW